MSAVEVLGLAGLVICWTYSYIGRKLRGLVRVELPEPLRKFWTCPQCIGFWVGLVYGAAVNQSVTVSFVSAGGVSVVAYLLQCVLMEFDRPDSYEPPQQ